jgi:hypothetical protein
MHFPQIHDFSISTFVCRSGQARRPGGGITTGSIRGGRAMLELQVKMLSAWFHAGDTMRARVEADRDRGEVTATTALIVILVIAAIAAGGVIAAKIGNNAEAVPEP